MGKHQIGLSGEQVVACPTCNASLMFFRSDSPHIDDCGFESYAFDCTQCGARLAGIVDPADDTLLLAEQAG
jgi:hypothetical protein